MWGVRVEGGEEDGLKAGRKNISFCSLIGSKIFPSLVDGHNIRVEAVNDYS